MARKELEEWFWQVDASLQRLTEAITKSAPLMATSRFWQPRVDLFESDKRFLLKVELAGVQGEDVQVDYLPDRHSILVRGTRHGDCGQTDTKEQAGAHVLEIFSGEFAREVKLPDSPIESTAIKSSLREGMLAVDIPKATIRVTHTRVTIRKV